MDFGVYCISISSLQVLNILDLKVLKLLLFTELDLLGLFSTLYFKHARIPVHEHFKLIITDLFIIISTFKNKLVCIVVSSVFSLFSFQVLYIFDLKLLDLFILQNSIFWIYFRLGVSNMQESLYMNISKESPVVKCFHLRR